MPDRGAGFRRVREVFEAAIERPEPERAAFVAQACGGDPALLREVEQLLACDTEHGHVGGFLDAGARVLVAGAGATGVGIGARVDAFRLCSVLGSGGMGTVYEAEQDEPRRRVALKVLSLGLAGEQAARRFRWEAEVLARLQHPAIAQVFAVGTHRSGTIELPWFAMELVSGARDLLRYADEERLSLRRRLELVLQVCDAVHHGHLHGVVHRDLKPQNVLVDRDGRVKVIDFGIARGLDGRAHDLTDGGVVLGTLHYMSPEQLRGGEIDHRTDVYALGVVAFELVSGRRPFEFERTTPLAVAETVLHRDPARLSAVARGVDRDLESVVHKALRREPGERYASAADLAEDLRAFLEARPVRARAPSTFYHVRMFARRRRGLVAALAAIAAVLVTGVAVVVAQNAELVQKERVARRVAGFARDFLAESSVMRTRGVDYTVREALDVAAESLDDEAFEEPVIEAELRQLVGNTYRGLSLPALAEPHLVRAASLWREADPDDPRVIEVGLSIVLVWQALERDDDAARLCAELERTAARTLSRDDPLWWRVQHNKAFLWRHAGRLRDAEALYREVAAANERLLGPDAGETVATLHNLGSLLLGLDEPEAARDVLEDALLRARRAGHADASTWQIADNLAEAWRELGELERAAASHRDAMQGFEQLLGPDHELTLGCAYHLLKVLHRQGEHGDMAVLATDLLARCERAFGPEHRRTMDVLQAVAVAKLRSGDADGAVAALRRAYEVLLRHLGPRHPSVFTAGQNLMSARLEASDPAGALAVGEQLVAALGDDVATANLAPSTVVGTWLALARALVAAERRDEASRAVDRGLAAGREGLPDGHPFVAGLEELRGELSRR